MNPYNGFSPDARTAAFQITKAAWAAGDLPRPSKCESCDRTDGRMESHDEDYDRPLDYYEVCYTCHMMIHCRYRDPFRWGQYIALLADGARFVKATGWPDFRERFLAGELTAQIDFMGDPRGPRFVHYLPILNTRSVPADLPLPRRQSA